MVHVIYLGAAGYVFHLWWSDLSAAQAGSVPQSGSLPGAAPARPGVVAVGIAGSLILLVVETGGEIVLGIHHEQSVLAWHFLFALVAASIIEEIIFRGYLIVPDRGPLLLWGSATFFSVIFALLHPYLWSYEAGEGTPFWDLREAEFRVKMTFKAWFSTAFVFLGSLWFYALRFNRWNASRSLLPCFAGHLALNLGVYLVKWAQGYIEF